MGKRERRRRRDASGAASTAPLLPGPFVAAARDWLGDEAAAFLEACSRPPRLAIRANGLKGGLDALWPLLGPDAPSWPRVPWWPAALLSPDDVARELASGLPAHIGALYAQDPAALAAVAALDPQPGERILDLCAAPGGKTTAIADRMAGQGLLVANDVEVRRARDLAHTIERWGASALVLALDSTELAALAPGFFDRVLVDAPCSGESMFARHPRAAADWSPQHVAGSAARQRRLLVAARRMVRPGGTLVYATCTFNPQENEGVIAAHLAAHPDDTLEDATVHVPGASAGRPDLLPLDAQGPRAGELVRCARLWPHRGPGSGHFVALIRAGDDDKEPQHQREGPQRPRTQARVTATDDVTAVRACVGEVAPRLAAPGAISVRGDRAFLVPPHAPDELVERTLAPGLQVAERRGRTWRPAHALALALRPGQAHVAVELDAARAAAFLSGHPVDGAGEGTVLACWHGYPLGWARARGGTLTPRLPSGVRLVSSRAL